MKTNFPSNLRAGATGAALVALLLLACLQLAAPGSVDGVVPFLVVLLMAAAAGAVTGAITPLIRLHPGVTTAALVSVMLEVILWLLWSPFSSMTQVVLVGVIGLASTYPILSLAGKELDRRMPSWRKWRSPAVIGIVVVCFLLAGVKTPASEASDSRQVVVVGVDGGSFNVLENLLERGEAPNFARMQEEGCSASLISLKVTASPRVWTSIATGLPAKDHGIIGFGEIQNEHLRAPRIWDQVARAGKPSLVYEWLVTWPPDRLPAGSVVVPGWMARSADTRPDRLNYLKETEIAYQKGKGLRFPTLISYGIRSLLDGVRLSTFLDVAMETLVLKVGSHRGDAEYAYARNKILQLRTNSDVFLSLLELQRFPFASVTFFGSDALSHKYWKYHEAERYDIPEERADLLGGVIEEYYRGVDAFLGRLMEDVGDNATVWVVSDHGFSGAPPDAFESRYTLKTEPFLELLGIPGSSSFVIADYGIIQPPDGVPPETVSEAAGSFILERNGKELFRSSIEGQGIRIKIDSHLAREGIPDLLVENVITPSGESVLAKVFIAADRRSGIHQQEGIAFAWGRGIAAAGDSNDISVLDLMPTWLRQLGLGGGHELPGRVLIDWMTAEEAGQIASVMDVERRALADGKELPTIDEGYLEWRRSVELNVDETTDATDRMRELGYLGGD